jgi:hypothetical protein
MADKMPVGPTAKMAVPRWLKLLMIDSIAEEFHSAPSLIFVAFCSRLFGDVNNCDSPGTVADFDATQFFARF